MTLHTPIDDGQITQDPPIPHDPEGGNSCVAYSAAYLVSDATNGRVHPTGEQVRDWTGDHLGGLELPQVDKAITVHTDLNMLVDVYTAAEFYGHLASGYGAVLLGGYKPVRASRFDAFDGGFADNHGWYVPPGLAVMDPGADGRRAGVYRYHGEAYPKSLIDAYAAALVVRKPSRTNPKPLFAGPNHFEAGLIHLEAAPMPAAPWELAFSGGHVWTYDANATHRTIADRDRHHSGGFSGECSAPARFTWPKFGSYTLVRMLTGSHGDAVRGKGRGWWIAKGASHVTIQEAA